MATGSNPNRIAEDKWSCRGPPNPANPNFAKRWDHESIDLSDEEWSRIQERVSFFPLADFYPGSCGRPITDTTSFHLLHTEIVSINAIIKKIRDDPPPRELFLPKTPIFDPDEIIRDTRVRELIDQMNPLIDDFVRSFALAERARDHESVEELLDALSDSENEASNTQNDEMTKKLTIQTISCRPLVYALLDLQIEIRGYYIYDSRRNKHFYRDIYYILCSIYFATHQPRLYWSY